MIAFVVDDEPLIATTLEIILIAEGFDARSFVSPVDALQAAQSVAPSLLISDVVMPDLNGFDLAVQIVELYPDCKILMFSGQTAIQSFYESAKSKGHDFKVLTKPLHPNILAEEIRNMFVE